MQKVKSLDPASFVVSQDGQEEILEEASRGSEESLYLLDKKNEADADAKEIKQMLPEYLSSNELIVNNDDEEDMEVSL